MTKLVRKLKQMAKKRAHLKAVQKRKAERAQKEIEQTERRKQEMAEMAIGIGAVSHDIGANKFTEHVEDGEAALEKKTVQVLGGIVLDAPQRKKKRQVSRKQMKRREKQRERGAAITAQLERKWNTKKIRIKQRAQIRNEDIHN